VIRRRVISILRRALPQEPSASNSTNDAICASVKGPPCSLAKAGINESGLPCLITASNPVAPGSGCDFRSGVIDARRGIIADFRLAKPPSAMQIRRTGVHRVE